MTYNPTWGSGGGGGAVDSVNGQTGVVVLDTDDISEGATNLYNKIPTAGTTGQVLQKASGTDYDLVWATPSGSGDVTGPASSTDNNIATFDGTTGKIIQDGGTAISALVPYTGATGDVDIGTNKFEGAALRSNGSGGSHLENASGTACATWGQSGGTNGTLFGGWNYDNATANTIAYYGASKTLSSVTIGSGLSFSGGTLSAVGAATGDMAAACFYDNAGGQTLTTTDTVINLDTTMDNSATGVFSLASDVVTVAEAGYYLINYDVSVGNIAGTRNNVAVRLQRDTGSGFADIDGSLSYAYARATTNGATASSTLVIELTAGDDLRIVATCSTANGQSTLADGSRLSITQLKGAKGDAGAAGQGVPTGGTAGQVLEKIDGTDYNTQWATPSSGTTSGWEEVETKTASSSSSITFNNLSSAYVKYKIVLKRFLPATNDVDLYMRTSTNNGSTYDSGASDYQVAGDLRLSTTAGSIADPSASRMVLAIAVANTAILGGCNGDVEILNFSTATYCHVHSIITHSCVLAPTFGVSRIGNWRMTAADVDAVQLYFESGNIASGEATLFGLRA